VFTYDALGRLSDARTGNLRADTFPDRCAASMSSVNQPFDQSYSYSNTGNLDQLVNRNVAASGQPSTAFTANYTYPAPNNAAGLGAHAVKSVAGGPSAGAYAYTNGGRLNEWSDAARRVRRSRRRRCIRHSGVRRR
jgi:hypothetical protein